MRPTFSKIALGVAVLVLGASLVSAHARADAVGPPPMSCPPGSTPTSSHAGPLCFPSDACTTDAECSMGALCMEVFQCIETRPCGGLSPPDSGPCTVSNVVSACAPGNACAVGTCFTRHVCSTVSLAPRPSGACGCAVGRSSFAPGIALGIALALVWAARARSRKA